MNAPQSLRGRVDGVVIGTSAGGVEALSALLPALPAQLAVPVFVVVHLPRERPSLLTQVFAPKCRVPVEEGQDKEPVRCGTVYFAPPDYHMLLEKGATLALSADEPVQFSRPSIDVLFESAADAYGERLLGIVLTGANQDGTLGMRAIQKAGGLTAVQDPAEAEVALMPMSVTEHIRPDWVLNLAGIAGLLRTLDTGGAA